MNLDWSCIHKGRKFQNACVTLWRNNTFLYIYTEGRQNLFRCSENLTRLNFTCLHVGGIKRVKERFKKLSCSFHFSVKKLWIAVKYMRSLLSCKFLIFSRCSYLIPGLFCTFVWFCLPFMLHGLMWCVYCQGLQCHRSTTQKAFNGGLNFWT